MNAPTSASISHTPSRSLVIGSYLLAIILDAMLLSSPLYWLPPISLLVIIYWSTENLTQTFIPSAFILGLIYDALNQSLLGLHALLFSLFLFLILRFRLRFRLFTFVQQALTLIPFCFLYQGLLWFLIPHPLTAESLWLYWLSPFSLLLLWPILAMPLRHLSLKAA